MFSSFIGEFLLDVETMLITEKTHFNKQGKEYFIYVCFHKDLESTATLLQEVKLLCQHVR